MREDHSVIVAVALERTSHLHVIVTSRAGVIIIFIISDDKAPSDQLPIPSRTPSLFAILAFFSVFVVFFFPHLR